MDPVALESLRARLRDCDRNLLRALAARAKFPRDPRPVWPGENRRLPPPPLAEILYTLAPAGTADNPDAENRGMISALAARQQIACEIADAKAEFLRDDVRAALALGDRDQLALLLTDLAAELRTLDFVRRTAPAVAPGLDLDLALSLWREYILPWTRQTEVDHLSAP